MVSATSAGLSALDFLGRDCLQEKFHWFAQTLKMYSVSQIVVHSVHILASVTRFYKLLNKIDFALMMFNLILIVRVGSPYCATSYFYQSEFANFIHTSMDGNKSPLCQYTNRFGYLSSLLLLQNILRYIVCKLWVCCLATCASSFCIFTSLL